MATLLLTVKPTDFRDGRLAPVVRLSEFADRPTLGRIAAGTALELIRPDDTRARAWVVDLSCDEIQVFARDDDGTMIELADNPGIRIAVAPAMTDWDAPLGTEIWVLDGPPASPAG